MERSKKIEEAYAIARANLIVRRQKLEMAENNLKILRQQEDDDAGPMTPDNDGASD